MSCPVGEIDERIANDPWLQTMENIYGREYVEQLRRDVGAGKCDDERAPACAMRNYNLSGWNFETVFNIEL